MNGVFLDSAIKSIARYLIKLEDIIISKYSGSVDIRLEIKNLNQEYGFVPTEQVAAFINDVYYMYDFERNRQLQSINGVAYAKFKFDQAIGINDLQRLKNDLHNELTNVR